jgi:hypothetical protein
MRLPELRGGTPDLHTIQIGSCHPFSQSLSQTDTGRTTLPFKDSRGASNTGDLHRKYRTLHIF